MMAETVLAAVMVVFGNGTAKTDIVVPETCSMVERYAAEELKCHLERASGLEFAVVSEAEASGARARIFVGATKAADRAGVGIGGFAPDERVSVCDGTSLYFRGFDRDGTAVGNGWSATCHGTLYAVYDFLSERMGVRWIWPGETGEVIPRRTSLELGAFRLHRKEPLVARTWRMQKFDARRFFGWSDAEAGRLFHEAQTRFQIRHHQGSSLCLNAGHNFLDYWRRFSKTHPEFFAQLPNGRREPLKGDDGSFITMCVSNPGLWKQIVEDWRTSPDRKPGHVPYRPYVNLCENDTPGMCMCPKCRAWDAPDPRFASNDYWNGSGRDPLTRLGRFRRLAKVQWGEEDDVLTMAEPPSVSDRYARFYNAVLAEARKVEPSVRGFGYAYANYVEAPRQTAVDSSLILSFVPRMAFPYVREESAVFRRQWLGWRKAGVRDFLYRPNYTLAGANFPLDQGRVILDDFAFAATNGMIGCYFDSQIGSFSCHAAMNYALFRALGEPTVGYARAFAEFLSAFGPAASDVRRYCELVAANSVRPSIREFQRIAMANRTPDGVPGGGNGCFALVAADLYSEEFFARADGFLDAAARAAAGDAEIAARVAFLRKGLKDALLTYRCRVAQKRKAGFREAFDAMNAYRASVERDGVADLDYLAACEMQNCGWPHKRKTAR